MATASSSTEPSLYEEVVRVTHVYLGPAADRFIARQVQSHLNKPPEDITKDDLHKLTDWIRVAVSLLTNDTEVVEEYISQLEKLSASGPPGAKKQGKKPWQT